MSVAIRETAVSQPEAVCLSRSERERLHELEGIIQRGLETFIEVGRARSGLKLALQAISGKQASCLCGTQRISILELARRMKKCIPLTRMIRMESRGWRGVELKRLPVFSEHATE
jgi:hypothetical protein